jgi:hypothetical protein
MFHVDWEKLKVSEWRVPFFRCCEKNVDNWRNKQSIKQVESSYAVLVQKICRITQTVLRGTGTK